MKQIPSPMFDVSSELLLLAIRWHNIKDQQMPDSIQKQLNSIEDVDQIYIIQEIKTKINELIRYSCLNF